MLTKMQNVSLQVAFYLKFELHTLTNANKNVMTACRYESGRYPRNVHLLGTVPVEAVGAQATPTYRTLLLLIIKQKTSNQNLPSTGTTLFYKVYTPSKMLP